MATAQFGTILQHIQKLVVAHAVLPGTDRQLLDDFSVRRDEAAFTLLVARHGPMVLRVCRRVLGHEQDTEDAFQATFLVLARQAGSIRQRETVANWLHGVAYRTAMKAKRSTKRRRNHEAAFGGAVSRPRHHMLITASPRWDDVQAVLDQEIQRLPDAYRSAFVLCVLEGKSGSEVAAALGIKEGTVSSRLTRARQRLQSQLARRGIKLASLLAALSVAEGAGEAGVPALLSQATIRCGLLVAAGEPAAGVIPSNVAALAAGVTRAMFLTKAKLATAVVLAVALLTAAGALGYEALAARQTSRLAQKAEPPARGRAAPQPASAKAPTGSAKDDAADKVHVSGRVLDPEGKPLRGAKLFVPGLKTAEPLSNTDIVAKKVGETDAEGRFQLTLDRPNQVSTYSLIAHAAGFGVDWVKLSEGQRPTEVSLQLVKDVPITGRVVNTEGRPIAGVSVSAASIVVAANGKLDEYLAGWLRGLGNVPYAGTPQKRLNVPLDRITGAVRTDKEGRFTLHGAGSERIVGVTFAEGVARSTPYVITRPGFDAKPYTALLQSEGNKRFLALYPFPGVYPPSLTFVAEPGKTIEGVVKDAASGKPIPGCRLIAATAWNEGVGAVSDADGKFRFAGVPKSPSGYFVSIMAPKGGGYLGRTAQPADTDGFAKVQFDIDLVKGAVVTGRVVDKQTGKGVQSGIRFAPLPDNKFFGSKPGFDNYRRDRSMESTDKDGRFRLATIPGKALIMAQVHDGEKFHGESLCVYRRAGPDPDHKDLFKHDKDNDSWSIPTAGRVESLGSENTVKVIDVKEDDETQVELFVDRGVTARIVVQDAAGQPLARAWAAGLTQRWPIAYCLPEATATVYALDPHKPRTMAFFHAEKKLGGAAVVRGDEKEPVVVKLAPLGQVSGRLLDADGSPLEGVEVSIHPPEEVGSELYRFAAPSGKAVRTDKNGRFRVEGVVPDLKFWLDLQRGRTAFVGEPRIGVRQVKPGERLELGDVRIKPAQ